MGAAARPVHGRVGRLALAATAFAVTGLLGCSGARPLSFSSPHEREHPLVGAIVEVATGARLSPEELALRLSRSDVAILGEKHDNADHHRLQGWLIRRIVAAGRRPVVALEMLDARQQDAADSYLSKYWPTVWGLAAALDWKSSGWPAFRTYAPVFRAALDAKLPIVAADLSVAPLRALAGQSGASSDAASLDSAEEMSVMRVRLGLDRPLDAPTYEAMAENIRDSHCGYLPEGHLAGMIAMQRARDAHLSDSVLRRGALRGAVLIAGFAHARRDRAVPAHLALRAPGLQVAALALLEVVEGLESPEDYLDGDDGERLPFDYVWWTPRASNEDPCVKFKAQLEAMRSAHTDD